MPLRPQTLYPAHAKQHPAVAGGNVAIISADNPRYPAQMQGEDLLRQELERLGLDYELTKGKYGAPERSFIISNPDLPHMLDLARRFGQESLAYSENGRHQLHFVNGPQAGMATAPVEHHQWYDEEPQDNYTAVPGPHGDPWGYFTWNIDFNSPMVPSQPTPFKPEQVKPLAQSEHSLAGEVRKWMESLGELRMRELAKAGVEGPKGEMRYKVPGAQPTPPPGVTVAPGVQMKPAVAAALAGAKRTKPAPSGMKPTGAPPPAPSAPGKTFSQPRPQAMSGRASTMLKEEEGYHIRHKRGDSESYVTQKYHYTRTPSEFTHFPDEASASAHADVVSRRHDEPRQNYVVGKGRGEPIRKAEPLEKTAPPGFSEKRMHELKRKYGTEGAFKVAWSIHNKHEDDLSKSVPPVTDSDAYFHPSEKNAPAKPKPAGPPAVNTYRAVPKDYRKAEDDMKKDVALSAGQAYSAKPFKEGESLTPASGQVMYSGVGRMAAQEAVKHPPVAVPPPVHPKPAPPTDQLGVGQSYSAAPMVKTPEQRAAGARKAIESFIKAGRKMAKGEDIGSAVAMMGGDVHTRLPGRVAKSEVDQQERVRRVREAEDRELKNIPLRDPKKGPWPQQSGKVPNLGEMSKSEKTDPLDAEIACKGCGGKMSPVVAALRKARGGLCSKCEGAMAKGELRYENNEPQHGERDNHWDPKVGEPCKAPGSGGETKKNPVGTSSNDGAKSVNLPLKAGAPKTNQHAGPAQTLTKTGMPMEAHAPPGVKPVPTTPVNSPRDRLHAALKFAMHARNRAPLPPPMLPPAPVAKAEGMPMPAAPKPPQAPGAKPSMAGGKMGGMGKAEPLEKVAPPGREEQVKELKGKVRNPYAVAWASYDKSKKLHKAIQETISLRKADPGSIGAARAQASHSAASTPTGMPPAGKAQPKSPAEYDAAAFRPASPGAAGAPSGLELDTPKFGAGMTPQAKVFPGVKPAAAAKPPAVKKGLPIAKMRGITGGPVVKK